MIDKIDKTDINNIKEKKVLAHHKENTNQQQTMPKYLKNSPKTNN